MELSYDKYERRFWLSLDVPLWLDRLFNPYQDCVEDKDLYVRAVEEYLRECMERVTFETLLTAKNCEYTQVLPRSDGDTYTRSRRYDNFPNLALPTDQE